MTSGTHLHKCLIAAAAVLLAIACGAPQVGAQADKKGGKGFSVERKGPIKIEAASLEVRDKQKQATFKGNVHVVQGETELRSNILVVSYENEMRKSASGGGGADKRGGDQIRHMEARGNVVITQKDQTATGEKADFDMRTNTVTLSGNVVVTRGEDVLRGQRLVVDLTTGVSRMESGGGRVEGLFRSSNEKGKPGVPEAKKENRNESKRPGGPSGLY